MPDSPVSTTSPLAAIRDKERALETGIREAEVRATKITADARTRAEAIRQQAESEGAKEADRLYQEGLTKAQQQANQTSAEGEAHAKRLHETGRARIGQAVDRILQFVVPR